MGFKEIIKKFEQDFQDTINHFREESAKIRTGRANASMIENIRVECYGSSMPIKQLAAISVPEARTILIQPWDNNILASIEKALRESDLGVNPMNDGQVVRLNFPILTEEKRKELVKILNKKTEESRIAVRVLREEVWKKIQEAEKVGLISEDEKFKAKDSLQKIVDENNDKIENIRKNRENDIMAV